MLVPTFNRDGVQTGYVNLAGQFVLRPVELASDAWVVCAEFYSTQHLGSTDHINPLAYVSRPVATYESALDFISDQFRPLVLPPRLRQALAPRE